MSTAAPVCRYFLQAGKCFYGQECKFSHDMNASGGDDLSGTNSNLGSTTTGNATLVAPKPLTTSTSSSQLAAGAKEWKPSASPPPVQPSTPAKPAASPTNAAATSKLNANKTPFKPGGAASITQSTVVGVTLAAGAKEWTPAGFDEPSGLTSEDEAVGSHVHHPSDESYLVDDDLSHAVQSHMVLSPNAPVEALAPPTVMSVDVFNAACTPVAPGVSSGSISRSLGSLTLGTEKELSGASSVSSPTKSPSLATNQGNAMSMSAALRTRLTQLLHLRTARLQPDDPLYPTLPGTLDHERYHSLLPIASDVPPKGFEQVYARTPNGGATSYKVTSSADGRCYIVKRLHGLKFQGGEERARQLVQPWMDFAEEIGRGAGAGAGASPSSSLVGHPNILTPRQVFLSKDFLPSSSASGSSATPSSSNQAQLCVVYDYIPTASALWPSMDEGVTLPLEAVWDFAIQLVTTITSVHEHSLSLGDSLRVGRVLVTAEQRILLSGIGLRELSQSTTQPQQSDAQLLAAQRQDWYSLACLIFGWLGRGSNVANINPTEGKSIEQLKQAWHNKGELRMGLNTQFPNARDLLSLIDVLLANDKEFSSATVLSKISLQLSKAYTNSLIHHDVLQTELTKELNSARLFRLMVKMGFVMERADSNGGSWSESGDRYLLSLFRDLVFHSLHSIDVPNLDFGHVINQLNKLDAGSSEKLLLSSRNGESMLLVRYADLKRCVEESYQELYRKQLEGMGGGGVTVASHTRTAAGSHHHPGMHGSPQVGLGSRSVMRPLPNK